MFTESHPEPTTRVRWVRYGREVRESVKQDDGLWSCPNSTGIAHNERHRHHWSWILDSINRIDDNGTLEIDY